MVLGEISGLPRQTRGAAFPPDVLKTLPKEFKERVSPLLNSLPLSYGTVRRVTLPPKKAAQRIVLLIQDVHHNPDAQRNIGQAIQSLIDKNSVDIVGLEGAFTPMDFNRIRGYSDKKNIQEVANYLLRKNKISGPVHAALTSPVDIPPFVGIDDPVHYAANVAAYRDSLPQLAEYQAAVSGWAKELDRRKSSVLNPALKSFDETVSAYHRGSLSLGDYVTVLLAHAPEGDAPLVVRGFKRVLDQENNLNFPRIERERAQLVEKIVPLLHQDGMDRLFQQSVAYRNGEIRYADFYRSLNDLCERANVPLSQYPALEAYIRYVLEADAIDVDRFLEGVTALESRDFDRLAKTNAEKSIVLESRQQQWTTKLLDFSLSPNEWAHPHLPQGRGLDVASFRSFYIEAQARDQAMSRNLLAQMEERNANVGVLVTGGYHSPGVEECLTKAGVAVIHFTPKIEKVDTAQGAAYLSVFTQEKTPLEKLFQGEKLFLATSPADQTVLEGDIPLLSAMFNMFVWGDAKGAQKVFEDLAPGSEMQMIDFQRNGSAVSATMVRASRWVKLLLHVRAKNDSPTIEELIVSPVKEQWYFFLPALASFCAVLTLGPTLGGVMGMAGIHLLVAALLWPSFRDRHQATIVKYQEKYVYTHEASILFLFSRYLFFNWVSLTVLLRGASFVSSPEGILTFAYWALAGQGVVLALHMLNNGFSLPASSGGDPAVPNDVHNAVARAFHELVYDYGPWGKFPSTASRRIYDTMVKVVQGELTIEQAVEQVKTMGDLDSDFPFSGYFEEARNNRTTLPASKERTFIDITTHSPGIDSDTYFREFVKRHSSFAAVLESVRNNLFGMNPRLQSELMVAVVHCLKEEMQTMTELEWQINQSVFIPLSWREKMSFYGVVLSLLGFKNDLQDQKYPAMVFYGLALVVARNWPTTPIGRFAKEHARAIGSVGLLIEIPLLILAAVSFSVPVLVSFLILFSLLHDLMEFGSNELNNPRAPPISLSRMVVLLSYVLLPTYYGIVSFDQLLGLLQSPHGQAFFWVPLYHIFFDFEDLVVKRLHLIYRFFRQGGSLVMMTANAQTIGIQSWGDYSADQSSRQGEIARREKERAEIERALLKILLAREKLVAYLDMADHFFSETLGALGPFNGRVTGKSAGSIQFTIDLGQETGPATLLQKAEYIAVGPSRLKVKSTIIEKNTLVLDLLSVRAVAGLNEGKQSECEPALKGTSPHAFRIQFAGVKKLMRALTVYEHDATTGIPALDVLFGLNTIDPRDEREGESFGEAVRVVDRALKADPVLMIKSKENADRTEVVTQIARRFAEEEKTVLVVSASKTLAKDAELSILGSDLENKTAFNEKVIVLHLGENRISDLKPEMFDAVVVLGAETVSLSALLPAFLALKKTGKLIIETRDVRNGARTEEFDVFRPLASFHSPKEMDIPGPAFFSEDIPSVDLPPCPIPWKNWVDPAITVKPLDDLFTKKTPESPIVTTSSSESAEITPLQLPDLEFYRQQIQEAERLQPQGEEFVEFSPSLLRSIQAFGAAMEAIEGKTGEPGLATLFDQFSDNEEVLKLLISAESVRDNSRTEIVQAIVNRLVAVENFDDIVNLCRQYDNIDHPARLLLADLLGVEALPPDIHPEVIDLVSIQIRPHWYVAKGAHRTIKNSFLNPILGYMVRTIEPKRPGLARAVDAFRVFWNTSFGPLLESYLYVIVIGNLVFHGGSLAAGAFVFLPLVDAGMSLLFDVFLGRAPPAQVFRDLGQRFYAAGLFALPFLVQSALATFGVAIPQMDISMFGFEVPLTPAFFVSTMIHRQKNKDAEWTSAVLEAFPSLAEGMSVSDIVPRTLLRRAVANSVNPNPITEKSLGKLLRRYFGGPAPSLEVAMARLQKLLNGMGTGHAVMVPLTEDVLNRPMECERIVASALTRHSGATICFFETSPGKDNGTVKRLLNGHRNARWVPISDLLTKGRAVVDMRMDRFEAYIPATASSVTVYLPAGVNPLFDHVRNKTLTQESLVPLSSLIRFFERFFRIAHAMVEQA